jgi:hypothetical protein
MRNLLVALILGVSVAPGITLAQGVVDIHIGFSTPPPLVVVAPGVQVVPDYDEEVFFANGWYWTRRDTVWYRTRDHRGGWVMVQPTRVPPALVRLPPGEYKHWRKDQAKAEKRALKAEQKDWKEQDKAERKARKNEEKAFKKASKHKD